MIIDTHGSHLQMNMHPVIKSRVDQSDQRAGYLLVLDELLR